jgi:hypothetical protein
MKDVVELGKVRRLSDNMAIIDSRNGGTCGSN